MLKHLSVLSAAFLMAVVGSAASAPVYAAAPESSAAIAPETLEVGDKAPALKVESYIKGEPVAEFKKGHVYVVEFWATWCGPCIRFFPHLSEMQKEYKDSVTIIGTNVWERGSGDIKDKVTKFVDQQGERMAYTVAYDGTDAAMTKAYMQAAGLSSIPTAFVVNKDGVVAFIGHPIILEDVVDRVIHDKWDLKTDPEKASGFLENFDKRINEAGEDVDAVQKALDEMAKDFPHFIAGMNPQRLNMLIGAGRWDDAYKLLGTQIDQAIAKGNAEQLNEHAWTIVDPAGPIPDEHRNLDLALKAAEKGVELSKGEDAQIIDTLARVYFLKGDLDKAIEQQTKAVEKAPEMYKAAIQQTLDEYKEAKEKKAAK